MSQLNKDEFLILHLSDLHFGKDNPLNKKPYSIEYYWKLIKKKIKNVLNIDSVDFVIVSGDIASEGKNNDFTMGVKSNYKA